MKNSKTKTIFKTEMFIITIQTFWWLLFTFLNETFINSANKNGLLSLIRTFIIIFPLIIFFIYIFNKEKLKYKSLIVISSIIYTIIIYYLIFNFLKISGFLSLRSDFLAGLEYLLMAFFWVIIALCIPIWNILEFIYKKIRKKESINYKDKIIIIIALILILFFVYIIINGF